jgi:hypothetical protein
MLPNGDRNTLSASFISKGVLQRNCFKCNIILWRTAPDDGRPLTSRRCSRSALLASNVTGTAQAGLSFWKFSRASIAYSKDCLSVMEYTTTQASAHCTCSNGNVESLCGQKIKHLLQWHTLHHHQWHYIPESGLGLPYGFCDYITMWVISPTIDLF